LLPAMEMKKIAAASVFALALVACIALFDENATESIKYYGESLSSLRTSSYSAPAAKTPSSSYSSRFNTDSVWDEDDSTPVPPQSSLSPGLSKFAAPKVESDFHDYSAPAPAPAPAAAKHSLSYFLGTSTQQHSTASSSLHNGDSVRVHYTLRLKSTGEEVYRQWGAGAGGTFTFSLGEHHVIPGFERLVGGMKVGEQRNGVVISASEGYGSKGMAAAKIPPNADLVYDIKVVGKN